MLQIFSPILSVVFLLYCGFYYANIYVVIFVYIFLYCFWILSHRKIFLTFGLKKNSPISSSNTNMVLYFIFISPVHAKSVPMYYMDQFSLPPKWSSHCPSIIHENVHFSSNNFRCNLYPVLNIWIDLKVFSSITLVYLSRLF